MAKLLLLSLNLKSWAVIERQKEDVRLGAYRLNRFSINSIRMLILIFLIFNLTFDFGF
jgi:hypothetical protein